IAWSNDSTKIATFNFTCNQNTCSRVSLDVFTLTGSLLKSVDLSSLTNFPSSQGTGFCQLQWSPNNNFIGFVQQCDITALGKPREVYIADISQGSLIQATFQTPEDMIFETSLFWAAYEITWINTRSLLIGVYKMDGILSTDESGNLIGISPPDVRNTLLFDVQDRTTQQISASRLGLWAYFEPNLLGYLDYIYPEDERLPSDANVEVATYDGTTLSVSASGPSGCHLTWDMSGTILAYFAREATYVHNCDGYVETIVFLDSVDGDISYHNTNEARAIGLGWISLVNTLEPTPIPNPCTAYPITTPDLINAITAAMVSS
ncbi:MAG: hypothetical protein K8I82_05015, partial [Anaerolineae bacterium]|nr:hypothetical protein [Anaerolineae bacterium]